MAQTGKPAIVNDAARDPRFTRKFDTKTQFETRSILCAPLISRGRTIGVVEIINRLGGRFTQTDLDILLTLVEPCAIAIENAMLFQRTEQLTITDDLTKLFNSRYMNLYIGREIKRCKRHGIPLSVIFLDLDGFKGINDQYGHLAGSGTLAEVGGILAEAVRESRHPRPLRRRRVRGGAARDPARGGPGHRGAPAPRHRGARLPEAPRAWPRASPRPSASPPTRTTP